MADLSYHLFSRAPPRSSFTYTGKEELCTLLQSGDTPTSYNTRMDSGDSRHISLYAAGWVALIILVFAIDTTAYAASVQWNTVVNGSVATCTKKKGDAKPCQRGLNTLAFDNPNVTVEYRAFIKNADTGEIVPPGGSIPQSTRLKLIFDEHVNNDIYWFATGASYDSPYGEWRAGAAYGGDPQCIEKDFMGISAGDETGNDYVYAALVGNPPARSLQGTSPLSCGAVSGSGIADCTADAPGKAPVQFIFAGTISQWYGSVKRRGQCTGTGYAMNIVQGVIKNVWNNGGGNSATTLPIPTQTISYPITITPAGEENDAPFTPTVRSNGACVVNAPHTISFSTIDPDGGNVRYAIDWNNDGTADQFVPASGYVASGISQSASRTFATAGEKTVKVRAIDEDGNTSGWATLNFICNVPSTTEVTPIDWFGEGGDDGDLSITPSVTLRAVPTLVRSRDISRIFWETTGASTCSVHGTNGHTFSLTADNIAVGSADTGAISAPTTYTLTCRTVRNTNLSADAIINIAPGWIER